MLDVLTWLLLLVPIFPLLALVILAGHWSVPSPSLHERTLLAGRDWVVASIAGVLALARLGWITLPPGTPLLLIAVAMLLVSIPSAYWLLLYWRGAFR